MMRIKFATLIRTARTFQPAGYAVLDNRPGPPLRRWLIRKMWQWLHNCGALRPYEHTIDTYEFGEPEAETIWRAVQEQMLELLDAGEEPSDYALVCGAATFRELTDAVADSLRTFNMPPFRYGLRGYRGEVRGVPLHVVPRMEGIALIPRVVIEMKEERER